MFIQGVDILNHKKVCLVIPAYQEKKLIGQVIKTTPKFVDLIIVVDDKSTDNTAKVAKVAATSAKKKLIVVSHKVNKGVGASIVSGFKKAIELNYDVVAVMDGDAQMAPDELEYLCVPVVKNHADYVKGNRLIYRQAWNKIPKIRYLGNSFLSLLTKIASGYWHVADSQAGYKAVSVEILKKMNLDNLYNRYGFHNDLLIQLNVVRARVKEIMIKPIYNVGEKSQIRLWKVIPTISWLLLRRFFWRLKVKYIIEDFHPLIFFYFFSICLFITNIWLFIRLIYLWVQNGKIPPINALALMFCLIMLGQFLFFAMWLDMDYNKDLKVK